MENYFIKLPNNLVWSYTEEEIALCNGKENNLLIPVLIYLDSHKNRLDKVVFTLEDLIVTCGMKPRTGKGNTIEQFKIILKEIQMFGWLEKEIDYDTIKPKELIKTNFNIIFKKDKDGNDTEFFMLYYKNFEKIIKDKNSDNLILLKVYCHIISRIHRNTEGYLESADKYMNYENVIVEYMTDTYKSIMNQLGIPKNSNKLFRKYLDILEELELIYSGTIGIIIDKEGYQHVASNVYVEIKSELDRALDCSELYYKDKNYKITGKMVSDLQKEIKGLKGKSKQLSNKGKDNTKIENKIKKKEGVK